MNNVKKLLTHLQSNHKPKINVLAQTHKTAVKIKSTFCWSQMPGQLCKICALQKYFLVKLIESSIFSPLILAHPLQIWQLLPSRDSFPGVSTNTFVRSDTDVRRQSLAWGFHSNSSFGLRLEFKNGNHHKYDHNCLYKPRTSKYTPQHHPFCTITLNIVHSDKCPPSGNYQTLTHPLISSQRGFNCYSSEHNYYPRA